MMLLRTLLILVVLFAFNLGGCKKKEEPTPPPHPVPSEPGEPLPDVAVAGETDEAAVDTASEAVDESTELLE